MEQTVVNSGFVLHWPRLALALLWVLLVFGALVFGSSSALLLWGILALTQGIFSVIALIGLYLAPGLALLRLLWVPQKTHSLAAYLALAMGVSVALPPVLLLIFHLLHLPWNAIVTWGYMVLSVAIAFFPTRTGKLSSPTRGYTLYCPWQGTHVGISEVFLAGISMAALLIRFYIVRDLPTGLFGDSYHHTIMAQLLVDNQGLFSSWQPYAPLASFTYHFGFHANAAFVHWMTGIDVIHSVIYIGQILNALSVPMAFLLVYALGSSTRAGVWAALITGFVSTLPAFYVNWGRYTQLTGHIVLVVVVVCWVALVQPQTTLRGLLSQWKLFVLAVVVTASMILTHYRVTVFAAVFVGSYILVFVLVQRSWRVLGLQILQAALASVVVLLLVSPWIVNLWNGHLVRNATAFVSGKVRAERIVEYAAIPQVFYYPKSYILLCALVGLCIIGWQRQWRMALLGLWSVLLVVCIVPYMVGLPGSGLIDYLTGYGALSITVASLAAYALATIQEGGCMLLKQYRLPLAIETVVFALGLLVVVAWGASWQVHIIDGSTQLVTHADMDAMAWIREHTPPDASFLVNSFPAYGGTLLAGPDAGWWLSFLTGRQSNLPPLTYGSEVGEELGYAANVNAFMATLRGRPLTDMSALSIDLTTPTALQLLRESGIEYVYIGAHASPDAAHADSFDMVQLHKSAAFEVVYEQRGVTLFRLVDEERNTESGL